jgi:hypothetical protein
MLATSCIKTIMLKILHIPFSWFISRKATKWKLKEESLSKLSSTYVTVLFPKLLNESKLNLVYACTGNYRPSFILKPIGSISDDSTSWESWWAVESEPWGACHEIYAFYFLCGDQCNTFLSSLSSSVRSVQPYKLSAVFWCSFHPRSDIRLFT